MHAVELLDILLIVGTFVLVLGLYGYLRLSGKLVRDKEALTHRRTSSEKLHYSKVHDAAFFDGAAEDYAEVLNRIKQMGGG
ncbi:MAG: hypothetical protein ACE5H4_13965 [Candidatus Thorarchaeota archaeon]